MLIMDSSGSMKKTDPFHLRKAAARLFISLLRDNDRVGLVSFSDEGRELSDLTEVADKQNRMKLIKSLDKITSAGKYTNIYGGIHKGYELLKASANKEKMLILMTDGRMDLGDKTREDALLKEMQGLLPELKQAGVKIHTIAFTESSDSMLLEDMALKTGGSFKMAQTDKDLHIVFASMFERIKSPEALPIKDNAFQVDRDIDEFTLLITKKTQKIRIALKDPAGKEHKAGRKAAGMEWVESGAFDMVTVKDPAPGLWNINFSAEEGNKVFILTNLKLLSSFSKTAVEQGKPIKFEAWLTKGNEPLKTKEILEHIEISVNIRTPEGKDVAAPLHDDGTNGDTAAGDGVYTLGLPIEQPGEYNLTLTADGGTFRREKVFVFKATAPVAIVVKTTVDEKTSKEKPEVFSLGPAGSISLALAVAVILLTVLCIYFYFLGRRYKKIAALDEKQKNSSSGSLEKYIGEKLNEMTEQPEAAGDSGSPVAQAHEELSALSRQFLQNSLEGVRKGGEDQVKVWDGIFSGFEDLAKGVVTKRSELQSEARALDEKLKGIDVLKDDNQRLKEVIDKQNAKITELMGYRDLLAESQQRLEAIQKGNEDLMTKIGELADKAEGFEELKELKAILERNNKELDTSLSILEEENIRLTGDYEKWQEELKKIEKEREHEKVMEETEFNRLAREKEGLEVKLKELKENLSFRDKALISLQQNYEALEKEYLALYKEHQQ